MSGSEQTSFAADFAGDLDADWHWLRQDPALWRQADGGLEICCQPGKADTVINALLRPAPDRAGGTYAVEVTVSNHSAPTVQYEQLGITWYSGGQPVFKLVKELIDGGIYIIPGRCPLAGNAVRLRLIVTAATWEAQYRPEGAKEFLTAASGELPAPDGDEVSLQCYNGPDDAEHWMRFEDFVIKRLD